jgi:hypothetical protein
VQKAYIERNESGMVGVGDVGGYDILPGRSTAYSEDNEDFFGMYGN